MSFFPLENEIPKCPRGRGSRKREGRLAEHEDGDKFQLYEEERARDRDRQIIELLDFAEHTDRKIAARKVWQRVRQGLADQEDRVNARREKLRELLLREQMELIRETVEQAQRGDRDKTDEMRRKTEELREQREDHRLALVTAKKTQQTVSRCPEIRERIAKRYAIEAKEINLAQIEDNEAKRREEEEIERLWHGLMLKDVEAKNRRDADEAEKRRLDRQRTTTALAMQIAGKRDIEERGRRLRDEDRENLERLAADERRDELERIERERRKREDLRKDLLEQIRIAERELADRNRKEAETDRLLLILADQESAKERSDAREGTEALREELRAYARYLDQIGKEEAERNLQMERAIERATKEIDAKRDLDANNSREAKRRGLRDCLRGRERQLEWKRSKEQEDREQRRLENEATEREIELAAELAARAREEARHRKLLYKKDLEDQQRNADDARRREIDRERNRHLEEAKRLEEYRKCIGELMSSENVVPHPFKIVLDACAARYAAEKTARCFRPPPLPVE